MEGGIKSVDDQENGTKIPTPPRSSSKRKNNKGPVSTSVKQSTGYITVNGIQSELYSHL